MSLPCGVRTSSSFIISVQFSLSSPRWEPNPSHPLLVMPVLASTSVSCITGLASSHQYNQHLDTVRVGTAASCAVTGSYIYV